MLPAHPRLPFSMYIPIVVIIRQYATIPVLLGHQKIYSIFVFGVLLILGVCPSCLPLASFGLRVR